MINERPNSVLVWSNSLDTSNCIEPSLGQKTTGWSIDDEPPAEWMNWFQNTVASYVVHLDEMATMWASNYISPNIFQYANSVFDIYDIAHGPYGTYHEDRFVFVGDSNEIIPVLCYDPDYSMPAAFDLGVSAIYSIEYGDGYWFLSTANTQYYSDDYLSSFTENDIGGTVYRMKYANGYWVCASTANLLYRANDPTGAFTDPWATGSREMRDIDYSVEDDLWVAVGEYWSSTANIWYKDHPPNDEFTGIAAGSNTLYCVAHGIVNGATVWLAGGDNNELYRSTNPKASWEQIESPFSLVTSIQTMIWGNGVFLIAAEGGRGGAFISRDGYSWARIADECSAHALDYYGNRFVRAGNNGLVFFSLRHGNFGNSL